MSRGIYEVCTCGHRYPEHSLFGRCNGCLDCPDVEERPPDNEEIGEQHPYRQCVCPKFVSAEGLEDDEDDVLAGENVVEPAEPV
jgi:hypothetical protein